MDEVSNVNNLNGVPNMGEGNPEPTAEETVETPVEETSAEEVVPTEETAPKAE